MATHKTSESTPTHMQNMQRLACSIHNALALTTARQWIQQVVPRHTLSCEHDLKVY